jgi:hypothetical protein
LRNFNNSNFPNYLFRADFNEPNKEMNNNRKKADKKIIRKADIGKAISATFVHLNHIGVSSEKNSFNVSIENILVKFRAKVSFRHLDFILRSMIHTFPT